MATENPRVGGSIPPLGTIFLDFQTVTLWVARGLLVLVSIAETCPNWLKFSGDEADQRADVLSAT